MGLVEELLPYGAGGYETAMRGSSTFVKLDHGVVVLADLANLMVVP